MYYLIRLELFIPMESFHTVKLVDVPSLVKFPHAPLKLISPPPWPLCTPRQLLIGFLGL